MPQLIIIWITLVFSVTIVENRMVNNNDIPVNDGGDDGDQSKEGQGDDYDDGRLLPTQMTWEDNDEIDYQAQDTYSDPKLHKECAVVVLPESPFAAMQSLLRKYRYDGDGVLIPDSVRYFMKLPQGESATPLLVPLNDKAISPLGGFVRYYKEVPPIPLSW